MSSSIQEPPQADPAGNSNGHEQAHAGIACACCQALATVRFPQPYGPPLYIQQAPPSVAPSRPAARRASLASLFLPFRRKRKDPPPARSTDSEQDDDPGIALPKTRHIWSGIDGLVVSGLAIVAPLLTLVLVCATLPKRITLVLLNRPCETLAELALVACVPIIHYFVWSALCKHKLRLVRTSSAALGIASGTCWTVAGIALAACFFGGSTAYVEELPTGLIWLATLAGSMALTSSYITYALWKSRDFNSTKRQVIAWWLGALALPVVATAALERNSFEIRQAEQQATAGNAQQAAAALAFLRRYNPEKALRMECADDSAAGLCGLFMPIKQSAQRSLYFALTGKPYSFRQYNNNDFSALPDDYLTRNLVGDQVPGLSLTRSNLSGQVHARTMSATLEWTFVFKNNQSSQQEARAELGLPPGGVITRLETYVDGEPQPAALSVHGTASGTPAPQGNSVTDLARGRFLLDCAAIHPEQEEEIRLAMVLPLVPSSAAKGTLEMPKIVAANFSIAGENAIRLIGDHKVWTNSAALPGTKDEDGNYCVNGTLLARDLHDSKLSITTERDADAAPVFTFDKKATLLKQQAAKEQAQAEREKLRQEEMDEQNDRDSVVVVVDAKNSNAASIEAIRQTLAAKHGRSRKVRVKAVNKQFVTEAVGTVSKAAPHRLEVVLDGSSTTSDYLAQIKEALESMPKGVPAELRVATQESPQLNKPLPLAAALDKLAPSTFAGGQNNLESVVAAAQRAGDTHNGAVLWIHGPQPAHPQEIYIMRKYKSKPLFYELTLGSADVDTVAYFKNHAQIGPFRQLPAAGGVKEDLSALFSSWSPSSRRYEVDIAATEKPSEDAQEVTGQPAQELITLRANRYCHTLLDERKEGQATMIAEIYHLVTPVSLLEGNAEPARVSQEGADGFAMEGGSASFGSAGMHDTDQQWNTGPQLQGATNGSIGPQGQDAIVVSGVNTAGTVRVNNLANLEALLNISSCIGELVFGLFGLVLVLHGATQGEMVTELLGQEIEVRRGERICLGLLLIGLGLALPGAINFFLSSARDANLFS